MELRKLKILRLKTSLELREVEKILQANKYSESGVFGFMFTDLEDNVLQSQYIEKKISTQAIQDPFGSTIETDVVSYQYIDFELHPVSPNSYILVLIEPQRAIKSFSLNLAKLTNYSISLDTLVLNVEHFFRYLTEETGTENFKVERLKISRLPISENSAVSMEIVSKANALDEITLLTHNKSYVLDRIRATTFTNTGKMFVEISKTGGLTVDKKHCESVLKLVKTHINLS